METINDHTIKWQEMVNNYINDYSPFQKKELVYIIEQGFQNPYEIQDIQIDKNGQFKYVLVSPRSHSALPLKYGPKQLSRERNVISHNE